MLSSISPLGERARHNRWAVTVAWYSAASVAVAAAAGLGLGAAGGAVGAIAGVPAAARAAALAVAAVAASLADASGRRLPGPRRQVDEDWLGRYRGWVYGAGYGAQLGAGVTTIVTTATVWLVLVAELLAGSAWAGAAVGAVFGLARAVPLLAGVRVRSWAALRVAQRRMSSRAALARRVAIAGSLVLAAGWAATAVAA